MLYHAIGSVYIIRFFLLHLSLSFYQVFLLYFFLFAFFSRATRIKLFNDFSCCCCFALFIFLLTLVFCLACFASFCCCFFFWFFNCLSPCFFPRQSSVFYQSESSSSRGFLFPLVFCICAFVLFSFVRMSCKFA